MRTLSKEFVQPEGFPDTPTVNQRTNAAVARLVVKKAQIPMNPKVTQYQLDALITVLERKGIIDARDIDEITYFTAYIQMLDLEHIVETAPTTTLLVPTTTLKDLS